MKLFERARAPINTACAAALALALALGAAVPAWADGEELAVEQSVTEPALAVEAPAEAPVPESPAMELAAAVPPAEVPVAAAPAEPEPTTEAPAEPVVDVPLESLPSEIPVSDAPETEADEPLVASSIAIVPTSIAFIDAVLSPGGRATAYFDGDQTFTYFEGDASCQFVVIDGVVAGAAATTSFAFDFSYSDLVNNFGLPRGSVVTYGIAPLDGVSCTSYSPGTPSWSSVVSASFTISTPVTGEPSETNWEVKCGSGAGSTRDYATGSAQWWYICLTDGSISDASTTTKGDAFDGLGEFVLYDDSRDWEYRVSADSLTDFAAADGELRFTDNDVQIPERIGTVDVVVTLTLRGSWATWSARVVESGTNTPAVVNLSFEGNLGSDSDTVWTPFAGGLVSVDADWYSDPALIHSANVTGGSGAFDVEDGDDDLRFDALGSSLTYSIGLLEHCGTVDHVAAGIAIGESIATHRDTDLAALVGADCRSAATPLVNAIVGEPLDVTVPFELRGEWDLAAGVSVVVNWYDLPDGVSFEIIDSDTPGVVPSIRFHGTPTEEGLFSLGLYLSSDGGNSWVESTVQVLPEAISVSAGIAKLTQGSPADVTVPLDLVGAWDLTDGAEITVSGLPAGVTAKVTGANTPGTAPTLRLVGTPLTAGDVTGVITVIAANRFAETDVTVQVARIADDLAITLGIVPGDLVEGAPVTVFGAGLMAGSPWSITVRSTPQVIASGVVGASGSFGATSTLPSGLETGWHSITVDAVLANAAAATRVLWFEIGADGTLLRVSDAAPVSVPDAGPAAVPGSLQVTGADASAAFWLGGALLAIGAALSLAGALRRRTA